MERFWTLRYLQQNGVRSSRPRCSRKAWCAPTRCRWCCRCWARRRPAARRRVRVKLGAIDLITLDVAGTVWPSGWTEPVADASDEDDSEDETVAGPIAIAVDVTDTSEAEAGAPVAAPACHKHL
jgi:exoribonuclease-2